jgi:hypothetical protein
MTTDNEAVLQQTLYSLLVRFGSVGLQDKILSFIQSPLFVQPNNHYLQIKELDNNMVAVAIIELPQAEGVQQDDGSSTRPSDSGSEEGKSVPPVRGREDLVNPSSSGGSAQEADKEEEAPIIEPSPPAPQPTPDDEPKSRAEKGD